MANNLKNLKKISKEITEQPWQFSLHQALFLLELSNKNKSQFGCGKKPSDEPALLNAYCSFSAPSSDCIEFKIKKNNLSLTINQTSLIGINGTLPQHYTEKIINQIKIKDQSLLDFLNIFNQRSFGLLHKITKKTHTHLSITAEQKYSSYITGLQTTTKWEKIIATFPWFLWQKQKTINNLIIILRSIFPFQFKIKQFVEKWLKINHENQAYLNNNELKDKVLGSKACCKNAAIELIITTHTLDDHNNLLPEKENYILIKNICKYYVTPGIKTKITLNLDNKKEKRTMLDKNKKLGLNSWILADMN